MIKIGTVGKWRNILYGYDDLFSMRSGLAVANNRKTAFEYRVIGPNSGNPTIEVLKVWRLIRVKA